MIDWVELSRAVPYAGTAIVFGLFMVLILRQAGQQQAEARRAQDKKDEELAQRQDLKDERRDNNFITAIERRDKDWRDFLSQQQVLRGEQWGGVMSELKQLTAVVSISADLLRAHDAWERGWMSSHSGGRRDSDVPPPHALSDLAVRSSTEEKPVTGTDA